MRSGTGHGCQTRETVTFLVFPPRRPQHPNGSDMHRSVEHRHSAPCKGRTATSRSLSPPRRPALLPIAGRSGSAHARRCATAAIVAGLRTGSSIGRGPHRGKLWSAKGRSSPTAAHLSMASYQQQRDVIHSAVANSRQSRGSGCEADCRADRRAGASAQRSAVPRSIGLGYGTAWPAAPVVHAIAFFFADAMPASRVLAPVIDKRRL